MKRITVLSAALALIGCNDVSEPSRQPSFTASCVDQSWFLVYACKDEYCPTSVTVSGTGSLKANCESALKDAPANVIAVCASPVKDEHTVWCEMDNFVEPKR